MKHYQKYRHQFMKRTVSLITIVIVLGLSGCTRPHRYNLSHIAMGTVVTITVDSSSERKAQHAIQQAFDEIHRIEQMMSPVIPNSDVYTINTTMKTRVSPDTFTVLQQALEISRTTNGLFDITFAPLSRIWIFQDPFSPPSQLTVNTYKSCVGYEFIHLNEKYREVAKSKPCTAIGLGGIAKGYALSQAALKLRKNGIQEGIVEAGGDIIIIGSNYGYGYTIGIKHPRKEGICGTIRLFNGQTIATSGDYERYKMYKGKRYHHIMNPKTGYPAQTDIISVSVIANDATLCDGYATALFIMGSKQAMTFLKNNPSIDIHCIIIDEHMNMYVSEELLDKVSFSDYRVQSF